LPSRREKKKEEMQKKVLDAIENGYFVFMLLLLINCVFIDVGYEE
jgi:hypothetical protein